jgi:hypothetical protein
VRKLIHTLARRHEARSSREAQALEIDGAAVQRAPTSTAHTLARLRFAVPRLRLTKTRLSLAGALAVGLAVGAGVFAYWTTGGAGTAAATVATLESPSVEATNPIPNRVEIEWTAVLGPNTPDHDTELEYTVERKPSSGSSWVFVCGTDVTPKPYDVLSCTDTVTVEGDYDYRVTGHFRSWTSEGTDSLHVTVDVVPPEVVSIVPLGPSPTNAASVSWTVTFSESVTGVGAGDFILSGPGSSGAAITGVTGGGSSYTVTASTGADGQLGLDLVDDDTIEDVAGNKLGGTGTGNGNFAGQTYLVDKTGPTVTVEQASGQDDPTNVLPIRFAVHFSEPVADFDATDVTRAGTATTAAANVSVTGSGQDYEIVFASPPPITDGTIIASIAAASAHDGLGNASSASTSTDNSVMYDTTKPTSSASGVDANWHNADVTVGLSATDPGAPATGSGVANIKYQVDGGALQTIAGNSGSVVIPAPSDHSNDGHHTITFYATDNATNQETPSNSVTVKIDTTKPTSSASGVDANWHNADVTATLSATDPGAPATGSGVATIKYQVDGGALQAIAGNSGSVVIPAPPDHSNDGHHTITFYATDNATNQETPSNSVTVKIDTTKPTTTLTTSPANADGENGWFKQSSVSFTLAATDPGVPATGSDIANVKYQVDGGTIQTYAGAVTISTQGDHTVSFFATDNAGNVEATNTTHIKLDNVAPTTTLTTTPGSPDGTNGWFKQSSVSFTLSGADGASGVASSFYTVDGGATQTYAGPVVINSQGDHTVTFWSTDGAGNVEPANTTHIKLDNVAPAASLATAAPTTSGRTLAAYVSGTSIVFNDCLGNAGFRLVATVTDTTSGAASTSFPAVTGVSRWTNHNAETISTPAGGPFTSTDYLWSANNCGGGKAGTPPGSYSVLTTDAAGNQSATSLTFSPDNTGPTVTNVTLNNGGVLGTIDTNDFVEVTYSEAMNAASFCSTWTNGSTQSLTSGVTVTVSGGDALTVAASGCSFRFGSVALNANYNTGSTMTFTTGSQITWDPATRKLKILLGTRTGGTAATGVAASVPSYSRGGSPRETDLVVNEIGSGTFSGTSSRF